MLGPLRRFPLTRLRAAAIVVCALTLPLAAADAASAADVTQLVDRPDGLGALPFDGVSGSSLSRHPLSADGRYVVFSSNNDDLTTTDDDRSAHVYRLDRATGALVQIDTHSDGSQLSPFSRAEDATVSADGRFAAFWESERTAAGTYRTAVYVKDIATGALTLASRATGADGPAAAGADASAVISGDGRHVVFLSLAGVQAANADGVPGTRDAYVRDLDTKITWMVSVTAAGAEGGGVDATAQPTISFDGSAAGFVSFARLLAGDTDNDRDAYLRAGLGTGAGEHTVFVSGTAGADSADAIDLSGDGSLVAYSGPNGNVYQGRITSGIVSGVTPVSGGRTPAFEPVAFSGQVPQRLAFISDQALNAGDDNGDADLYESETAHPGDGAFVHLMTSGHAHGGVAAGATAGGGTTIVFAGRADDLPGNDGTLTEVYLRAGASDTDISQPPGAVRVPEAHDSILETTRGVSADGHRVAFVASGRAFGSMVQAFTGGETLTQQIAVRDVVSGRTLLASARPDGTGTTGDVETPQLDAAGDRVAFMTGATDLGFANPTHADQAVVRDLGTGRTTLVSTTADGRALPDGVRAIAFSGDGRHLAYATSSHGRPGIPDSDAHRHVIVVDLRDGSSQVADRADGAGGALGTGDADAPALDFDGSRVAFEATAANLPGSPTTTYTQIEVRDLAARTTTWVSRPQDAANGRSRAFVPEIDAAGARVAYQQRDPSFGHGMTGAAQAFVTDFGSGTTTLASVGPDGNAFPLVIGFALSADGRHVAFAAGTNGLFEDYRRDLDPGTTTALSTLADGTFPGQGVYQLVSLSADGSCAAFDAADRGFVPGTYGPDWVHVYLRCPAAPAQPGSPGAPSGPGAPGGPPAAPPGRTADRTAPVITRARLTHRRFAVGTPARKRRRGAVRGTTFTFTLSEAAKVRIAMTHAVAGRRSGRRCVAPRQGLRRRCTRTLTVLAINKSLRRGAVKLAFTGRSGRTALRPGRYTAVLVARDAAGNASRAVRLAFTVVRA